MDGEAHQSKIEFPQTDATGDVDMDLLRLNLTLTPTERWRRHASALALVRALRKAGAEYYGRHDASLEETER